MCMTCWPTRRKLGEQYVTLNAKVCIITMMGEGKLTARLPVQMQNWCAWCAWLPVVTAWLGPKAWVRMAARLAGDHFGCRCEWHNGLHCLSCRKQHYSPACTMWPPIGQLPFQQCEACILKWLVLAGASNLCNVLTHFVHPVVVAFLTWLSRHAIGKILALHTKVGMLVLAPLWR